MKNKLKIWFYTAWLNFRWVTAIGLTIFFTTAMCIGLLLYLYSPFESKAIDILAGGVSGIFIAIVIIIDNYNRSTKYIDNAVFEFKNKLKKQAT